MEEIQSLETESLKQATREEDEAIARGKSTDLKPDAALAGFFGDV
jgi:hypothetical protein